MRYYKEKEVEVKKVKKYEITKIECDHCEEFITKEDPKYCKVVAYPKYPDVDAELLDIHRKCLYDYLTNLNPIFDSVRIEYDEFRPYICDEIDPYYDTEDKSEDKEVK